MLAKVTIVGLYNYDDTLFDGLSLPDGVSKDDAVFTILERNGDFPLLYPDFDFLKTAIGVWSRTSQTIFNRMYATTTAEYNPIENYDRHSVITRDVEGSSGSESIGAQTSFNSGEFADTDKSTGESSSSGSETATDYTHGNIGVTSSQELLQQERDVSDWNFYNWLADNFATRFCIKIY